MRQGFIALPLVAYIAIGAAVAIAASSGVAYVQTKRLHAVQTEYTTFKANVKALGEAQEKRTQETILRQKKESDEAEIRSQRALADIRSKYDRLRQSGANRGQLPTIPDTAPVTDAAARDSRLLEILRISEEQTRKLEELQDWVRSQQPQGVKP